MKLYDKCKDLRSFDGLDFQDFEKAKVHEGPVKIVYRRDGSVVRKVLRNNKSHIFSRDARSSDGDYSQSSSKI